MKKVDVYETIVFGWILTAMERSEVFEGQSQLELAEKVRDLLKRLKNEWNDSKKEAGV